MFPVTFCSKLAVCQGTWARWSARKFLCGSGVRAWSFCEKLISISEQLGAARRSQKKHDFENRMAASRCKMERLVAINEQMGVHEECRRQLLDSSFRKPMDLFEVGDRRQYLGYAVPWLPKFF